MRGILPHFDLEAYYGYEDDDNAKRDTNEQYCVLGCKTQTHGTNQDSGPGMGILRTAEGGVETVVPSCRGQKDKKEDHDGQDRQLPVPLGIGF